MKQKSPQGFTLIELIIVIAIIAVLAALAFMAMSGETAQARDSKRISDLKTFEDSVATANGKNKRINYTTDSYGADHANVSRDDTQADTLQTTSGVVKAIRGAYLLPVTETMFDSDILPTVAKDPKGANYVAAFLSQTDYLFFATKENPDTKTPLALVRGSFKDGSVLDILNGNLGGLTTAETVSIANPSRFVRGDVIKIDDEMMVVAQRDIAAKTITVKRGFAYDALAGTASLAGTSTTVHNKGAAIKLIYPAANANSLVCLGALANATTLTTPQVNTTAGNTVISIPGASSALTAAITALSITASSVDTEAAKGAVCNPATANPVVDEGTYLPYKVN